VNYREGDFVCVNESGQIFVDLNIPKHTSCYCGSAIFHKIRGIVFGTFIRRCRTYKIAQFHIRCLSKVFEWQHGFACLSRRSNLLWRLLISKTDFKNLPSQRDL